MLLVASTMRLSMIQPLIDELVSRLGDVQGRLPAPDNICRTGQLYHQSGMKYLNNSCVQ